MFKVKFSEKAALTGYIAQLLGYLKAKVKKQGKLLKYN